MPMFMIDPQTKWQVAKTTAIMGAFGYFCYVYGTVVGSDSADSWQVAPAMALYQVSTSR